MTTVLEEFRLQARFCAEFGSPYTSELLARAADDIAAGGIVANLTDAWPGHPRADALCFLGPFGERYCCRPPSGGVAARTPVPTDTDQVGAALTLFRRPHPSKTDQASRRVAPPPFGGGRHL